MRSNSVAPPPEPPPEPEPLPPDLLDQPLPAGFSARTREARPARDRKSVV